MLIKVEEIKRASEIIPADRISMLGYGPPGSGKSDFGGSAGDDTLIINTGKGKETLLSNDFKNRRKSNPFIVDINEQFDAKSVIPTSPQAFDAVSDVIDQALVKLPDINTYVLDDLTSLSFFARLKAIRVLQSEGKSKSASKAEQHDMIITTVQDYGAEMDLIEQFMRTYCDIFERKGKNFIVLAHEKKIYGKPANVGEQAPVRAIEPLITGKDSADKLCGMFDWVIRFSTLPASAGNVIYVANTVGDGTFFARCRGTGGVFQPQEKNPDFRELKQRVMKSRI